MKMGTALSSFVYDAVVHLHAPIGKSATLCDLALRLDLRRPVNLRTTQRIGGCLDFALHKPANIAHGDGEIILSLQVDPELRATFQNRPDRRFFRNTRKSASIIDRLRIILADEPTAAFDSKRAQIAMDLLRKLAVDQNAAIIAVTHDEKIFDRFDDIFLLRDGRLEGETAVSKVLERPSQSD